MDIEKEPSRFQKAVRFLNSQPGAHLMLVFVLLLGAYFRLLGVNWDANQHQQPDERFMTMVAEQIHSVAGLSDYFDPETSTLNPLSYGSYTYGMLPLFLTRYVAEGIARTGYDDIVLVGRVLSAIFDLAAGLMLYLLGGRLYGRWAGLLATALYATAVLPIQLSHFFAVDSFTTLFMLAAFYAAVMIMERPSSSAFALFGIANGLALATKVSIAPLALIAVFASVAHLATVWSDKAQRPEAIKSIVTGLLLSGLCSGILFRLFQPYAFAGPGLFGFSLNPRWLEIMGEVTAQVTGRADYPPSHHWAGRSWSYAWSNLVRWGMGLPLGLTATAAWFWAAWRILRGQWRRHLLPVLWVGGYFLWQNSNFWRYNRYFLPIYPLAILLAAWLLLSLLQWAGRRAPRMPHLPSWRRLLLKPLNLASLLLVVVLLGTSLYAYAFSRIYTRPHTRVAATEWLRQEVPGPLNVIMETGGGQQLIPLPVPYEQFFKPEERWATNFIPPQDGRLLAVSALAVEKGDSPDQTVDIEWTIIPLESDQSRPVQQTTRVNLDDNDMPVAHQVLFPDTALHAGEAYELAFKVLDGAPVRFGHETIAVESSWDDALPLRSPGYDPYGGVYKQLDLGLFEPDTAAKRVRLVDMLVETEYLVVASNRVYDAAPRMPLRYPLTLAFYQALFDCDSTQISQCAYLAQPGLLGELGFELAAVFESYPNLGPFSIPDQSAMESFTVYDHPKVFVFEKDPDFSPERVAERLAAVDLQQEIAQSASQYTSAPSALRLSPERWQEQKKGGTWVEIFPLDTWLNQSQAVAAIAWYLLLMVLGWLVFPIVYALFPGLAFRGYGLARLLALLLTGWLSWLAGSLQLLPFSRGTLLLALLVISIVSELLVRRRQQPLRLYLKQNWRHLLFLEGLFGLLFLLSLTVRLYNPDLWHPWRGGERPGELAMFSAILKSVYFPPYEPWLAGHQINYYYFGYLLAAVPTKLLGIVPALAFNLLLPTWFAMTGLGIFSAAFNLVAPRRPPLSTLANRRHYRPAYVAGLLALTAGLLLGNLYQVRILWRQLPGLALAPSGEPAFWSRLGDAVSGASQVVSGQTDLFQGDNGFWYFEASRAILNGQDGAPITEFPYFTFLYGDLHPHLLDMPLVLAALVWMIGVLRAPWLLGGRNLRGVLSAAANLAAGGLIIGATYPTNTWDFPVMQGLGIAAVAAAVWMRRTPDWRSTGQRMGLQILLLTLLALGLYAPFRNSFATGQVALEWWSGPRTPLLDYFAVHGLFLYVILSYLLLETAGRLFRAGQRWQQVTLGELSSTYRLQVAAIVVLLLAVWLGWRWAWYEAYQTAAVALILTLWSAGLAFSGRLRWEQRAALALISAGLGLTLLVELVTLAGDVGRMNVVFKSYLLVWFFFSIAAVVLLGSLWRRLELWNWRWLWLLGLQLLLLAALSYPLTGTLAKIADRWPDQENPPRGLDGFAFLAAPVEYEENGQPIPLDQEYAAIRWVQANLAGTPTIVEGHTPEYQWGTRFSSYTGLPGVVGWRWHLQQRNRVLPPSLVEDRINDVTEFYNTPDRDTASSFLRRYGVDYVIVGPLERALYDQRGLLKFDQMVESGLLTPVYPPAGDSRPVTIYAVR